jgi:SAM-dependent methyltransferase
MAWAGFKTTTVSGSLNPTEVLMPKQWTADAILDIARSFQPACILAAAADLDLFGAFGADHLTADAIARRLRCNRRGITVLLDALVALQMLHKQSTRYSVPASIAKILTYDGADSVLAMAQHQANCLRRWDQLAKVIKTGKPAPRIPSIRGETADTASFIGAMHAINARVAAKVVRDIQPLPFNRLLDVGGASGTWTIAYLHANLSGSATIFDLPPVIPLAAKRLTKMGLRNRVNLVKGNFYTDPLPKDCDLAWVSAIVHQNSRHQNRMLFRKVYRALDTGGRIAIRDILMEKSRTAPISGALFAVNMLVGTKGGGTFTFEELRDDLKAAGFGGAKVVRHDDGMNAVIVARKRS